MKSFNVAFTFLTFFGVNFCAPASAADWHTDYDSALTIATKEDKMLLLDFTGSDWCGWCIRLKKDIFSQSEFEKFAKDHLVLFEVDFPHHASQVPALISQNQKLSRQFGVRGFPTLILLDQKGEEISRKVGYIAGGPDAFIQWVKNATNQK
ncbi:MAG: thioredoxin family protein [Chthoniobacterales bacterium]|nr:thioredoxin family protein [Chthoniobacterales bacterium]